MSNDALTSPRTFATPQAGGTTSPDGGRRGLQTTLGVLSVIPFLSGLAGILAGPKILPGTTVRWIRAPTANIGSSTRSGLQPRR
jgi:hypothetical protein